MMFRTSRQLRQASAERPVWIAVSNGLIVEDKMIKRKSISERIESAREQMKLIRGKLGERDGILN